MNEKKMYYRIRNYCGLLGMLLPFIAMFSAALTPHEDPSWGYSISATYYQTPALAGILTAASIVLMTYDGYDWRDNLVTTISGVFGIGIVLFPCAVVWKSDRVGFFQLPVDISHIIHCICATAFFLLLGFNSFFLFTLSDGTVTKQKKIRNVIYRLCGIGMLVFMIWQFITVIAHMPGWWTMINEIFLLFFFGISWLTKGGIFFKDK